MKYFKLTVVETCRNSARGRAESLNEIVKKFKTTSEATDWLTEHYGRLPRGRGKVYCDKADGKGGTVAVVVGVTHSFWNRDVCHDSNPWCQTDWISLVSVAEESISPSLYLSRSRISSSSQGRKP